MRRLHFDPVLLDKHSLSLVFAGGDNSWRIIVVSTCLRITPRREVAKVVGESEQAEEGAPAPEANLPMPELTSVF